MCCIAAELQLTFTPVSQSPEKHISVVAGLGPGHSWSIKKEKKVNYFYKVMSSEKEKQIDPLEIIY